MSELVPPTNTKAATAAAHAINARSQREAAAYVNRLAPMVYQDALRTHDPDVRRKNFDSLKDLAGSDARPLQDDKANLPVFNFTITGGVVSGNLVRDAAPADVVDVQAKPAPSAQSNPAIESAPGATDAEIDAIIEQAHMEHTAPVSIANPLPPLDPASLPGSLEALSSFYK